MSFQYGSDTPNIHNPFKREGTLYIVSGILIAAVGLLSLFIMRKQLTDQNHAIGWIQLAGSILLLGGGITYMTGGLLKVFRFYIGRGIPASLSKNEARSEKHVIEPHTVYGPQHLDQMMTGRKNLTFLEPVTLLDRMVYSTFPKLLFLPYSMRNYLHVLIQNTGYSVLALAVYLLALLSGSFGLTSMTTGSLGSWLGIALTLVMLLLWIGNPLTVKHSNVSGLKLGKKTTIVWVILLAVLVPAVGELLSRQGIKIPAAPFHPVLPLLLFFLIILFLAVIGLLLANKRAELYDPVTEVSEFREHWQENVHPKDFFRSLDMELASLRYKEFPNRVYRELTPNLQMEGSMDKGSFAGDTIQETQPIYEEIHHSASFQQFRFWIAVGGHVLVVLAALLLLLVTQISSTELTVASLLNRLFYPALLWIFGSAALTLAHLYWAEMHFTSYLIQFQGEGTYTESRLSVGMAITDSTRSENTVVRTSFSPWLLVTSLVTSTQASSGTGNLAGARYIISMHKADDLSAHLVERVRSFVNNNAMIATTVSEKDYQAIQSIYAMNEAAPAKETFLGPGRKKAASSLSEPTEDNGEN